MMPNEMSNEEFASKLEKVLPGNYYIVEAASRIRELEELKFNHLPKVEHALQRANTAGMKCDETIADLRSRLREAENGLEAITNMEGASTMRFYAKKFLRQIRGEDDRVIVEYKGKRYVRKVDSDRVFDIAEIDGDIFLRLQDANGVKRQTILLKEIEDKKPESCSTTGDGRLTIDEAISHASEVADRKGCTPCGNQHKQLADWLTELKALRKRMDFLEKVRLIPKDYQGCLVKWTVEGGWHDKDGQVEGELGQINTEHYGCISNIKDGLMRIEHCSHIAVLHNLWVDMIQCDEAEKDK